MISPHHDNPRYVSFRGTTGALVTAGEHYGAVTNGGFDFRGYLDMLAEHGLNLTRLVLTLRESESEFKGSLGYQNTLAPRPEFYAGPWARSETPGHLDGGALLDLDRWNPVFVHRLREFCALADARDIAVEITFFSQNYSDKPDSPWRLNPLNPANNVQREGATAYNRHTTCENPALLARQESLVRMVVAELRDFGNVYYEICNEPPYPESWDDPNDPTGPGALGDESVSAWQNHMARVIREVEAELGVRHPIAVNNPRDSIEYDLFDILTYHYREWSAAGLRDHWHHGKIQAFDETLTGIIAWNRVSDVRGRRRDGWEFLMRGFAIYDYLDVTVATDDPRGIGGAEYPGGSRHDGTAIRRQLGYLKRFMDTLELPSMAPDDAFFVGLSETVEGWALSAPGKAYAAYIFGGALASLRVALPAGSWVVDWYSPVSGDIVDRLRVEADDEATPLRVPVYADDIALRITRGRT